MYVSSSSFAIGAVLPSASSLDEVTESSASMHGMSMEFCSASSGEAGLGIHYESAY